MAPIDEAPIDETESGMDSKRASATAPDTDDSGPTAKIRPSVFETFAMPGLREKMAAKLTSPAKRARADKNSVMVATPAARSPTMVQLPTKQPAPIGSMLFALPETSETTNSTDASSADEPSPPKVVTSVALASLSESEPLGEESVVPELPQPEAMDESADEIGRSSPTNTVNSSACSEAPRRRRKKKKSVLVSGGHATETASAERSIAEAPQLADANVISGAKVRRRRTKKVIKEKDPYSDDPYAVELDPIELDL